MQVWWLLEEGREWVLKKFPAMIQVTKTQDTPFEEFEREHIQKVNDDWTTPLVTFRQASLIPYSELFLWGANFRG